MAIDIRDIKDMVTLIRYFSQNLGWDIDINDFEDIDDISYDFCAEDIGLKEEAFAKINSIRELQPLVDGQKWGVFCVEFDSRRFEVSALRKILSGLVPKRRNSAEHAVWDQQDLMFLCIWGNDDNKTIGIAHFEDKESGLPQIKMVSCAPAIEDFTQIKIFEDRIGKLSWPKDANEVEQWRKDWTSAFTNGYHQIIRDSSTLTVNLATEAQGIRDRILETLDVESSNGYVHLLFEKFKNTLIHDMTSQEFADMYAQTVVYGLFSARCMDQTQDDFTAAEAIECIPTTNPFLKSLLRECLGSEKSKLSFDELEIENVVELLRRTETTAITQDFNRQTGGGKEDPVIHFYEEFLTAYDKSQRVQRGVYYTPQAVVDFIVDSVDSIIKNDFDLVDGLASTEKKEVKIVRQSKKRINGSWANVNDTKEVPAIQILDPATGTGTFLREIILKMYEDFCSIVERRQGDKTWNAFVSEYLLQMLNGFEIMMAPYAVAHMKLAMVLKDTGYNFDSDKRLNIFLTNTLEEPGNSEQQIKMFDDPLAFESIEANGVKKNPGINIVIGNPPYSTESSNKGEWISKLMGTYKLEPDGKTKLKEKNSKPLNDDYVKFIRYAQFILNKSSNGILAFINPHGFLDGPIYRGMRAELLRSFDKVYLLDLHGNANRQETTPDGTKDENVFDIKQGVCIMLLIKTTNGSNTAKVYKKDLYGEREYKYAYLQNHSIINVDWNEIYPSKPYYMFCDEDLNQKKEYVSGFSIKDLFKISGTGVLTKRDNLCIHFKPEEAFLSASEIVNESKDKVVEKYNIPKDVRDWKYEWAKDDIINTGLSKNNVQKITYRPFDDRYTYYTGNTRGFMGWPVVAVMKNMMNVNNNIALVTARSNKAGNSTHFFVSRNIVEYKCGERTTNSSVFPLYLSQEGLMDQSVNFNTKVLISFQNKLNLKYVEGSTNQERGFSEKDLFSYIYAILNSPWYRKRYKEFLNKDFPIIPYPNTQDTFWKQVKIGDKLISAQLFEVEDMPLKSSFYGSDRVIGKIQYKTKKVFINSNSYFDNVDEVVWNYIVGGYQPCARWLKERKGYKINETDIKHYINMISAIYLSIDLMQKLDELVP